MSQYHGHCHCGAVAFEINTTLENAAVCNCSMCKRRNGLMHRVQPEDFKLLRGKEDLTLYQFNTGTAKHYFCSHCGIYPFHRPRRAPGVYAINVHCLEGVGDEDIAALTIEKIDGRGFSTP